MAVQIDVRAGPCEAGPLGSGSSLSSCAISSTATSTFRSRRFGSLASMIVTGRYAGALTELSGLDNTSSSSRTPFEASEAAAPVAPPRKCATSSSGRCVADSAALQFSSAQPLEALN